MTNNYGNMLEKEKDSTPLKKENPFTFTQDNYQVDPDEQFVSNYISNKLNNDQLAFNSYDYKYKIFDEPTNNSEEDSLDIDVSMLDNYKNINGNLEIKYYNYSPDNRQIKNIQITNKANSRNKSYINKAQYSSSRKDNNYSNDLEEETICLQNNQQRFGDEEEDSVIFSEKIAICSENLSKLNPYNNFNKQNKNVDINDIVIFNDQNSKKILDRPDAEYFLTKIKLSEIFLKIFKIELNKLEKYLFYLFKIDANFSILFFLNLIDSENNYEKLIDAMRKVVQDKDLIGLILTSKYDNTLYPELGKKIAEFYFNSFDLVKNSLKESINKSFKSNILII